MVLPHTWRPFGVRMAGALFGGALLLIGAVSWFAFPPDIRDQFTPFQRGTVVFLVLVAFSAWFALVRSRVVAEDLKLVVVNGYKRREFEWAEVIAVRLPSGAPWAVLDLADGGTCAVMGIQGSDGARARRAVRELRGLLDA
jgi:hypothetical protein